MQVTQLPPGVPVCSAGSTSCPVTNLMFNYYLENVRVPVTGYEVTYKSLLGANRPTFGDNNDQIICNGNAETYYIGLFYVDAFKVFHGVGYVPLICHQITDLNKDHLVLCIIEVGGFN